MKWPLFGGPKKSELLSMERLPSSVAARIVLAAPENGANDLGTGRFNGYAAPANLTEHL
jgi:hypothetical protein